MICVYWVDCALLSAAQSVLLATQRHPMEAVDADISQLGVEDDEGLGLEDASQLANVHLWVSIPVHILDCMLAPMPLCAYLS